MDLSDLRKEYDWGGLSSRDLAEDPFQQFDRWFQQAIEAHVPEPSAMTLATADASGAPSARTVLLKSVDANGFTFFTNYQSRKGRELDENPRAALNFYWPQVERQICVRGTIRRLSREASEAYFRSRPRGNQIGAWVSKQSSVIPNRESLERKLEAIEKQFSEGLIPMPDYWGGFVLDPAEIEFWQGRPNRLHDRFRYRRTQDQQWVVERLSP